jgi:outer membrane biosynthesis protein TonB
VKAEIRRIVGLLPLMLLSMALLSVLVRGSGVLAHPSFQSPVSPPPPTVPPSPTATAIPPTETPQPPTPTETPEPTETPQTPTPTETLVPGETPLPSPTTAVEAAPPAAVASPIASAEETPSQSTRPSRSWADYMAIGVVALAYTWRAFGVLALIAFLGLVIFLASGRWRS